MNMIVKKLSSIALCVAAMGVVNANVEEKAESCVRTIIERKNENNAVEIHKSFSTYELGQHKELSKTVGAFAKSMEITKGDEKKSLVDLEKCLKSTTVEKGKTLSMAYPNFYAFVLKTIGIQPEAKPVVKSLDRKDGSSKPTQEKKKSGFFDQFLA